MLNKVGIFITNGSEDIETVVPADIWNRSEFLVDLISIENSLDIKLGHNIKIKADYLLQEIELSIYNVLYIPGGDILDAFQTNKANKLMDYCIKNINNKNITFVALCAAPFLFNKWGLIKNKKVTCYPGIQKIGKFEDKYTNKKIVIAQNIITGNGPGSSFELAYTVVEQLKSAKFAYELKKTMQYNN